MLKTFNDLKFKFPWRSYQAKLLTHFEDHIADHHFHVIAPPGSGKTILGIEILRKLDQKTLVLAPTLTIRNQWENRLQNFFTETKAYNSYSFDLKTPGDITFSTYQALFAFYQSFEDKTAYFNFFKQHNIETLVLDEAHHLKNAWWFCLMELKKQSNFSIVALTATPPYDSSRTEVSKYFELCGDIDDEITVPDLVKERDLCPHHDFVYFSKPNNLEINFIADFRIHIADFNDRLLQDTTFISFLVNHRLYKQPNWHLEDLYANTEYFSAILIFLHASGQHIESQKLEVLGFESAEKIQIPNLDLHWLSILFQNLLVTDRNQLISDEAYLYTLEKQLRRLHVFNRKKVDFIGGDLIYKSLANSPSKLNSIVSIVNTERQSLATDLRCVILTDYIRKEFLDVEPQDLKAINKIGVLPIFHHLRLGCKNPNEIAVLSGSIVIIHHSILKAFKAITPKSEFEFTPIKNTPSHVLVSAKGQSKTQLVNHITTLFEAGDIKVLIGTKALLGEGWDAPAINSLILASFVGSFVSSNQMRGRAIRKDPNALKKTSNIWHLACIDPTQLDGGREVDTLKRRFEAFIGIANSNIPFISNGFDRLDLLNQLTIANLDTLNKKTLSQAKQRNLIADKWDLALGKGTKLTKEITILHTSKTPYKKQKQIYYFDAVQLFFMEFFFGAMLFYVEYIATHFNLIFTQGVFIFIKGLLAAFFVAFGYKFYKALMTYIRYGFLYRKIKKMGCAIIETLNVLGHLTTSKSVIKVVSSVSENGHVTCYLEGATAFENTLFSKALRELIEPIDAPRYVLINTNRFRKRFDLENVYPVPELFGSKKEYAEAFQKQWTNYFRKNKLLYTRHIDGRKLLLKARLFHSYNAFKEVSKETLGWK